MISRYVIRKQSTSDITALLSHKVRTTRWWRVLRRDHTRAEDFDPTHLHAFSSFAARLLAVSIVNTLLATEAPLGSWTTGMMGSAKQLETSPRTVLLSDDSSNVQIPKSLGVGFWVLGRVLMYVQGMCQYVAVIDGPRAYGFWNCRIRYF